MKTKNILVGVVIVAAVAGAVFYMKSQQDTVIAKQSSRAHLKGTHNAAVKIVEYSDFQCPSCKSAQPALKKFLEQYYGKISLEFRHYPLSGHVWASVAHQSAECAGDQGKFWEFHDKLFETQKSWSGPKSPVETFMGFANGLGLNLENFATCLSDEAVKARVMAQRQTGTDLQVKSTPTIFINDTRLVGPSQIRQNGDKVIREALGLPAVEAPKEVAEDHTGHDHA